MPLFYLASQSPRRRDLLAQLGWHPELLLPADAQEAHAVEALEQLLPRETPRAYVQRVTRLKAQAALQRLLDRQRPHAPVLVADTTVALGRTVLGKPADQADAHRMLSRLSGRSHLVLTAVVVAQLSPSPTTTVDHTTLIDPQGQAWTPLLRAALSESRVRFAALTSAQIDDYIATGEPFGKAGAYALQGRAAEFVERIVGSPSGIIGLPLAQTSVLLAKTGLQR